MTVWVPVTASDRETFNEQLSLNKKFGMRTSLFLSSLACIIVVGCQSPITTPVPVRSTLADSTAAWSKESIGQQCTITLKSESDSETVRYEGVIKSFDEDSVVLMKPAVIVEKHQFVPVIGKLPIVKRSFKNVGVARESLQSNVTIARSRIAKLKHD